MPIQTKQEIINSLSETIQSVSAFYSNLEEEIFYAPIGEKWSPAEHLHHLYVSAKAVVKGLKVPKLAFYAFGTANSSRPYDAVISAYQQQIAAGGQASGKYIPKNTRDKFDQVNLIAKWDSLSGRFNSALNNWDEKQLDKFRMPHPLMGKITVREMLFFTIYHTNYHKESTAKQLKGTMVG